MTHALNRKWLACGIDHARRPQRIVQLKDGDGDVVERGKTHASLCLNLVGLRRDNGLNSVVVDLDPLFLGAETRRNQTKN